MKGKKLIYIVLGIVLAIGVVMAFEFFLEKEVIPHEPMTLVQPIYYVERENSSLKEEEKEIGGKTLLEMLNNAVNQMRVTPKNETLAVAIPDSVEILEITLDEGLVKVNLSEAYNSLKTGEEMFCRAALVWTLTGFYFVDEVEILVNGSPLKKTNGEAFGPLGRDDLIVNAQIEAEPTTSTRVFKLYFSNSDATELVKEERTVEVNPNQPIEKYVMEQLIAGPKERGHYATIPPETKIRDIQTQDKICYVDLSEEFVTKHNGGSTGELLTIYSIVNSICEISGIEKVQFLIEGEKQDEYKGHIDFGKPFEPKTIEP